ncbi:MAG: hypothetical protein QS99_C0014G0014 [archaeon GW2011_AR4]|nr:MAG: hypothetical protein QS99_C0014G0014 [archaeon GW2011_AR4]
MPCKTREVGIMDDVELGGNITLSGFKDLDPSQMVVVKKMVGNYAREFSQKVNVHLLHLRIKPVHRTEKEVKKHELHIRLDHDDGQAVAEGTDFNLFVLIDDLMKKVLHQIEK